jgi:hypothetical protein
VSRRRPGDDAVLAARTASCRRADAVLARIRARNGADARVMFRDTLIYAVRQRCGRYFAITVPIVLLPFNVQVPKAICRAAGTAGTRAYDVYRPSSGGP